MPQIPSSAMMNPGIRRRMNKKRTYVFIAAGMLSTAAYAQVNHRNGQEDTLKTRIVTRFEYNPTVSDAKKLAESPTVIDTTLPKPAVNYLFHSRQMETAYQPDTIQPATMKGEPLDPLFRNYVKLGAGNGINYLADVYLNTLRSRQGALGADLHVLGSQGALKDLPPATFSNWNGSLYGKRFLDKHELTGRVGYDRERLQYYGYDDTNPYYFSLSDDDYFRQVYQEIFVNAGLRSFYTDSAKLNHEVDVHYDRFMDRNNANSEHNAVLNATVSRFFMQHHGRLELLADMNMVNYTTPFTYDATNIEEKNTNFIIGIKPVMTSQAKKWRIELGLNAQAELASSGSTPRLYPLIYAKYNLVKEIIIPYAGIKGGMQRNNLNTLTGLNPFLWTGLTVLRNTNEVYHVYGGVRGAFSERITFNLRGARYLQRDAALFVNYDASEYNPGLSRFGENYFTVLYDTLQTIEAGGELGYRVDEKLHIIGTGVYRSYSTTTEFEAWQRPAVEITATAFYQLRHKIIVKGQAHYLGPQWSKSYDPASEKYFGFDGTQRVYGNQLKSVIDVNIGAEYRYTERLSAFLNINNLLAQRYQRWNQYPVQRINVVGGVTYSFWKE